MESLKHRMLVNSVFDYISNQVPLDFRCFIEADIDDCVRPKKLSGGFIPDVYYSFSGVCFIGEAKTARDFFRQHSMRQYESYVHELMLYGANGGLVIAVPWMIWPDASNYFRRLKKNTGALLDIAILSDVRLERVL